MAALKLWEQPVGDVLVTSTDNHVSLLERTAPHALRELITRCNISPRDARFNAKGTKCAVASDELVVKLIDVRDTLKIEELTGHTKAVRDISWHPDGTLLVSSSPCVDFDRVAKSPSDHLELGRHHPSMGPHRLRTALRQGDGWHHPCRRARVRDMRFSISSGALNFAHSCMERCAAVWHPQGSYFAAATKAHGALRSHRREDGVQPKYRDRRHPERYLVAHRYLLDRRSRFGQSASWSYFSIIWLTRTQAIVALAWSANGNYLVSAGQDRQIIVWDAKTRTPVTRCAVPSSQILLQLTSRRTRLEDDQIATEIAWRPGTGSNAIALVTGQGQLYRWQNVISSDKPHPSDIPRPVPAQARHREVSVAPSRGRRNEEDLGDGDSLFGGGADDDWLIDDLDNANEAPRRGATSTAAPFIPPRSLLSAPAPRPKGQPTFQAGSTAWKDKRRYLAFNDVGVIHIVDRDAYNVVTVDFHDQGSHPGYHFEDYNKYTMASLGQNGALFANEDDMIMYRPFSTWTDTDGEWVLKLGKDESPVAVAMGPKVGVVATDAGYLRFVSAAGLQVQLVDFGREVVALAMGTEFGMVVHRPNAYAVDGACALPCSLLLPMT